VSENKAKLILMTMLAIMAFAGNSLLTRLALSGGDIGPAEFIVIRLISGAAMLASLAMWRKDTVVPRLADLPGVVLLFTYATAFTFAYVRLGAAVGALILFPAVQLTLAAIASSQGLPLSRRDQTGLLTAMAGLALLLAPRAAAPPLLPALLMALAGIAWGIYTMLGRRAGDALALTTRFFVGAGALSLLLVLVLPSTAPSLRGFVLAIVSGTVTSALGYVAWYAVVPRVKVATAGAAQLLVPMVTAAGGLLWLGESVSLDFVFATLLILSGVWLTTSSSRVLRSR